MKNTGTEYMSTERTPTVRPDFAELLPPLSDEQLSLLEADILKNGCYTPVIVSEDMVIVDGHNRAGICDKHGVPYRMAVFSFEDDLEAKQWALDTQKSRRNLEKWELGKIALKLKPEIEARAKANMVAGGGDQKSEAAISGSAKLPNPITETVDTRKELANAVGLKERTMGMVMQIGENAAESVKAALDNKAITINQGYNITKELQEMDLPDEEKEQAAMEAVEREIARKNESRKRKISEEARIAKAFSAAFEHAAAIRATVENVQLWVENSGILYDQLDSAAEDARDIANTFSAIADILINTIKPRDWRYKYRCQKKNSQHNDTKHGKRFANQHPVRAEALA